MQSSFSMLFKAFFVSYSESVSVTHTRSHTHAHTHNLSLTRTHSPSQIRPKSAVCAKSTVDMLGQSGLKYAYAQSKGRWVNMGDHKVYIEGDLDRSRKKVKNI